MSELDKYFQPPATASDHPVALMVQHSLRYKPDTDIQFELRRERNGLTFRPAKILIHFSGNGGNEAYSETDRWDGELNRSLIEMGTRAISIDNEKERFGLTLGEMLEKPEIKAGVPSLFNTIFIDILKASGFGERKEVREKLDEIPENSDVARYVRNFFRKKSERPLHGQEVEDDDPNSFNISDHILRQTAKMIKWRLQKCGSDLTQKLNYTREEAETILAGAIAYYLDERFSITNRELLGFK